MKTKINTSTVLTNKAKIIERIYQLVPIGAPKPQDPALVSDLQALTKALIQCYGAKQLQDNPFDETRERTLYLYESEIYRQLQGKVILVTGGEGFIGSRIIEKLHEFDVQRIVSVDIASFVESSTRLKTCQRGIVSKYVADVRDYEAMKRVFEIEQPDIVFHLAAQRLPGLAEIKIRDTVSTNIFGSKNIIQLCETFRVKKCIFSSTGKALRYFVRDVYAASKKMAEWQFAAAAQVGNVTYGMTRFTHVVENGFLSEELDRNVQRGLVSLHSHDRYMYAQNVSEAVHLLLNALVLSEPTRLKFIVARNLGWPIDVLEVALHKIVQSGKAIPLYFQGLPPGYEEHVFQGLFDWSGKTEFNPMTNVLEAASSKLDSSGELVIAEVAPFSTAVLNQCISELQTAIADPVLSGVELKACLAEVGREMARSFFSQAQLEVLANILKWGVDPKKLDDEGINIQVYSDVIELLVQEVYRSLSKNSSAIEPKLLELNRLIEILTMPSIAEEVKFIQHAIEKSQVRELSLCNT